VATPATTSALKSLLNCIDFSVGIFGFALRKRTPENPSIVIFKGDISLLIRESPMVNRA
jgi:hypothetical protein